MLVALEPLCPKALAAFQPTPVALPLDHWLGYGEILNVRVHPDGPPAILAKTWS